MKTICFIVLSFVAIHTTAQDSESIQLTTPKKGTLPFEVNKNAISFNYADLAVNRVSLSYERLIKEGMLGIKVPVSFSINSKPNGPKYYGGLGLQEEIYICCLPLFFWAFVSSKFVKVNF